MKVVKDPADKKKILETLPKEALRIKVEDEFGKKKWRDVDSLHDTDIILLKGDDTPYVMNTKPGRNQAPVITAANDVVAERVRQKGVASSHDPILRTVKSQPDSGRVLDHVMVGLAEEAFSLGFEREEAERSGNATSAISVRRVNALKSLADTYLKKKELISQHSVDLESNSFKTLFSFIMETFRGAMEDSNLRTEMIETVFAKLSKRLEDDWEDEAKNRMRNEK